MKRAPFIISLMICDCVFATAQEQPEMIIDSGVAEYDGKTITLSNHVVVEHGLGKISANSVEITTNAPDTAEQTHSFTIKENVVIALVDGGQLSCAYADINYQDLVGQFHGDTQHEYVIYTERDKKANSLPLIVKSRHMTLQLAKESPGAAATARNSINSITAEDHVTVSYQNDFHAAADYATYHRVLPTQDNPSTKPMAGLIALRSSKEGGLCQIINRRGDIIRASHICIDTLKHHILFAYPKGALYSMPTQNQQQRLDFSSDTMTWDEEKNLLTLRDHVVVNQQDMGVLTNDKEIQIFQKTVGNTKQLRSIESTGTTVLTYTDEDKQLTHTLTCYGKACIDQEQCQTTMDSPRNAEGNIDEDKQVFFEDKNGEIHADQLTIYYTMAGNTPIPTKIVLEGHARILNRSSVGIEGLDTFLQYALADVVEYTPQTKELTLSSKGNNRVLFFDRTSNLQVSATSLKVRRDQVTDKECVQGMGDVRFSFIEEEREQMRKKFHLEGEKDHDQ